MIGSHPISLDCLSLTSAPFSDLIPAAGSAGFDLVSLWLNPVAPFPAQVVGLGDKARCGDLLAQYRIGVHQIEAFDLVSPDEMEAYRPHFALGAALGARSILFYNSSLADRESMVSSLRAACALAGDYGLSVNVEPVSFSRLRRLSDAQALIEDAGVDSGIVLDFLHFTRAGGMPSHLDASGENHIRYVQVNDGPLHMQAEDLQTEAMLERTVPGQGSFPIADLLRRVPEGVVIGMEVPQLSVMKDSTSAFRHARRLMASLQAFHPWNPADDSGQGAMP